MALDRKFTHSPRRTVDCDVALSDLAFALEHINSPGRVNLFRKFLNFFNFGMKPDRFCLGVLHSILYNVPVAPRDSG